MRIRAIGRTVLALAAATALLAGCGGNGSGAGGASSEPAPTTPSDNGVSALAPEQVLERAKAALKAAKSYRIKGDVDNDGTKMSLDFKVAGNDMVGTLTMDGASVELLSVSGQQYIRPDEKFWTMTAGARAGDDIAKLMGDKWAKVSKENKDFAALFGVASVEKLLENQGTLTKGETREIDGVKTIGLVDGGAEGGILYVATTGEPYPILMQGADASQGQVGFSEFGATFDQVKAPAEAEVIDLEDLKRK